MHFLHWHKINFILIAKQFEYKTWHLYYMMISKHCSDQSCLLSIKDGNW